MTHSEKIEYMRIALNIVGFNFKTEDLDEIISVYELVNESEGKCNIGDILNVKKDVCKRHESLLVNS